MNAYPEALAQDPNVEVWWADLHVENSFGLGGLGTQASHPTRTWVLALLLQGNQSWFGGETPVGTSLDNCPDFSLRHYQV